MKWIKKAAAYMFIFLFCLGFSGCSSENIPDKAENGVNVEALQEVNEIPADGIITEEQMATIEGREGYFKFTGSGEGFCYVWTYNGKMIKNPQAQNLKVTLDNKNIDAVKAAANDASAGIGIKLESMHMAAPASLEITIEEKWDADTVICCKYMDNKVYKINDVDIVKSGTDDQGKTVLTFNVLETGDMYYLVGGNSKAAENKDESKDDEKDKSSDISQNDEGSESEPEGSGNQETVQSEQPVSGGNQETVHTCTISIECSTILNNWDDLDQSKAEFVPANGWILYPSEVEFTPGDTVFDVLKSVCAQTGIHMSSRYTPVYGSYYIEGINQLYEFDCGQNSGWMYRVNGWYPNYGCSSYEVSDGDNIEWRYTCDLGVDVGGGVY